MNYSSKLLIQFRSIAISGLMALVLAGSVTKPLVCMDGGYEPQTQKIDLGKSEDLEQREIPLIFLQIPGPRIPNQTITMSKQEIPSVMVKRWCNSKEGRAICKKKSARREAARDAELRRKEDFKFKKEDDIATKIEALIHDLLEQVKLVYKYDILFSDCYIITKNESYDHLSCQDYILGQLESINNLIAMEIIDTPFQKISHEAIEAIEKMLQQTRRSIEATIKSNESTNDEISSEYNDSLATQSLMMLIQKLLEHPVEFIDKLTIIRKNKSLIPELIGCELTRDCFKTNNQTISINPLVAEKIKAQDLETLKQLILAADMFSIPHLGNFCNQELTVHMSQAIQNTKNEDSNCTLL